ncbi:hypothetical protein EHQ24_06675 [Leptospira noumeaensis]|uniref:DUF6602 domain-containing protein n=1 Tax=Leptospira noumeaensis TaxID=2484964 RepID=A0A4R9I9Y2_9LEPT|nr:DUF6602 domain-containing protein [Leptospira noumeaensis]TGK83282.1 hypothetical protein EHQ24_06675 [Leptospira noumeaensis]
MSFNLFFQEFAQTRAKNLVNESENLTSITHNGLKGSLREHILINFLKDFLPINYEIGKGQIQDVFNNNSSESDLIIWQKDLLPPILLDERMGIFPYESCRYWIEVKTKTTRAELINSIEKVETLMRLRPLENYDPPWLPQVLPAYFSYSSDLTSDDEFSRFIDINPNYYHNPPFVALCIVGKGYWTFFDHLPNGKKWLFFYPNDSCYEVISFLAGILNTLAGRNKPSFGYYILEPEANNKGIFL